MPAISNPHDIIADPRFARIRARDRSADGDFVYAVGTTGVYCRPSCGARPAKPENIAFYADGARAKAAGYRPCKRCKPDDPAGAVAPWATSVAAYLDRHHDESLSLNDLAQIAKLSPSHLQRRFKQIFGVSPREYQAALRLKAFKAELRAGEGVASAAFGAGYGSTSRVYERLDGGLGMTPSAYRAGGAGEAISYAVRRTALGPVMMAATDRGVCFVEFGDDAASLRERLAREFPRAEIVPSSNVAGAQLDGWMEALDRHLSQGAAPPDLPLDLRGTAFQIRVWRFLLGVPSGTVLSYTELAERVGSPRAVRAVASACAANRIGLLVPCHRVLRADGGLGGYRWGIERKRALLERERRQRAAEPS